MNDLEIDFYINYRIEKDTKFSQLKEFRDNDFIYINRDRGYLSIDINHEQFRQDSNDQAFIFTVESLLENGKAINGYKVISWDDNEGVNHREDIQSGLKAAQSIANAIAEKYNYQAIQPELINPTLTDYAEQKNNSRLKI